MISILAIRPAGSGDVLAWGNLYCHSSFAANGRPFCSSSRALVAFALLFPPAFISCELWIRFDFPLFAGFPGFMEGAL